MALQDAHIIYAPLYLQQNARLPIVQFRHLVKLKDCTSKTLHVSAFDGVAQDIDELRFPSGGECSVQRAVLGQIALGRNDILLAGY